MLSKGKSALKERKIFLFPVIAILLWLFSFGCDNGANNPIEYGCIYVESTPPGATIYLDGVNTGEKTPATLTGVEKGNHQYTLIKEGWLDYVRNIYVYPNDTVVVEAILSQHSLTIYWKMIGFERTDSAWVPKDSLIKLEARDQNGNPITGITWHTSDNTVISIDDSGYVRGLEDWFDNGNRQPEAIVWAEKNELTSNEMIVQTVINLTGEWKRESDGLLERNVRMHSDEWAPRWWAGPFSPIGGFKIFGDSLYWKDPYGSDRWASGHVSENGKRVKFRTHYAPEDTLGALTVYIKNSP